MQLLYIQFLEYIQFKKSKLVQINEFYIWYLKIISAKIIISVKKSLEKLTVNCNVETEKI